MDDWRMQQQRLTMNSGGVGPMHGYHSMRARPSPYQYQQSSTLSVKTESNSNVYTPLPYTPTQMEQIHHQQRIINTKSTSGPIFPYHPGHQQMSSARARSMPYPSPSTYAHASNSICQCSSTHMHYASQHPVYYQAQAIASHSTGHPKMKSKFDESFQPSSTSYHPSIASNAYIPAQQLPPQDYQTFSNPSQIFPSPSSNPSTPYQGEFNGNQEFGVPYHQSQPSSVNSLTDALCPSGDATDRQMTPGPPSVGTPRVAPHQYSFPQTPSTPRLSNEQSIDELTAFLQDPVNIYLTDDLTSTLFDDIEVLADTYLGGGRTGQQSHTDSNLDYDIILNYLCSDDLISTVCKN